MRKTGLLGTRNGWFLLFLLTEVAVSFNMVIIGLGINMAINQMDEEMCLNLQRYDGWKKKTQNTMDDKIDTYDQILGQCALPHVHPSRWVLDKVPYDPKVPNNQTRIHENPTKWPTGHHEDEE